MNLLRAELLRIGHRRITWAAFALIFAWASVAGVVTFAQHADADPDMARAQAMADRQTTECRLFLTNDGVSDERTLTESCVADPAWFAEDPRFHMQSILEGTGGQEWSEVRDAALTRTTFDIGAPSHEVRQNAAGGFNGHLVAAGFASLIMVAILGATWIGADWRSGVMESQLVWNPDRKRLLVAKAGAIAIGGAAVTVVVSGLTILSVLPSAMFRGDFAGTGLGFWGDVVVTTGRSAVAAAVMALLGGAIALLTRHTAAGAVAVLLWSMVAAALADVLGKTLLLVSPFHNLRGWIGQSDVTFLRTLDHGAMGSESFVDVGHGFLAAGAIAAGLAVIVLTVASGVFLRRDVS